MSFDYDAAIAEGYSDQEILDYLKPSSDFDFDGAVEAGYSAGEISRHLSGVEEQPWQEKNQIAEETADNQENMGDFMLGVNRGIQSTQAMGYGMIGLTGSALGLDAVKNWGMEGYRRNTAEAEKYAANFSFKDVYTGEAGVGGTVDWVQGTMGELVPSMVEAAMGAAIGSVVMPGGGTAVGAFTGKTILKKSIEKTVGLQLKKGLIKAGSKEALEEGVELVTKQALKKFGGKVGMVSAVLPMEAGGNYGSLLEEHGVDAPYTSLFFGALATAFELLGGNSKLIDTFIDGVRSGGGKLIKRLAKNLLNNSPQEAFQEGGQQVMQILNKIVNTDEKLLTKANVEEVVESMAAGFVGGSGGAILESSFPAPKSKKALDHAREAAAKLSGIPETTQQKAQKVYTDFMADPHSPENIKGLAEALDKNPEVEAEFQKLATEGKAAEEAQAAADIEAAPAESAVVQQATEKGPVKKSQYFNEPEGSQTVAMEDIVPREAVTTPEHEASVQESLSRMSGVREGTSEKRKPLTVFRREDGKYVVLDGNATYHSLQQLKEKTAVVNVKKTLKQQHETLDSIYKQAEESRPVLKNTVEGFAKESGGEASFRTGNRVKDRARAEDKARVYGTFKKLKDVLAATLTYGTEAEMRKALAEFQKTNQVLEVKDKFKNTPITGYRDVSTTVRLQNGHLVEVQFTTKRMLEAKNSIGHKIYAASRSLAKLGGEDASQVLEMLDKVSKQLYDAAYSSASSKALSSEIGIALDTIFNAKPFKSIATRLDPSILSNLRALGSQANGTLSESKNISDIGKPPVKSELSDKTNVIQKDSEVKGINEKKESKDGVRDTEERSEVNDERGDNARRELREVSEQLDPEGKAPAESVKNKTPEQTQIEKIAAIFNIVTNFFAAPAGSKLARVDGFVARAGSKNVQINSDAVNPLMFVAMHELTHQLQAKHPELYDLLLKAAVFKEGSFEAYKKKTNDIRKAAGMKTLSNAEITDELLADITGDLAQNKEFWRAMHEKNASATEKIINILKDIFNKMKSVTNIGAKHLENITEYQKVLTDVMAEFAALEQQKSGKSGKYNIPKDFAFSVSEPVRKYAEENTGWDKKSASVWEMLEKLAEFDFRIRQFVSAQTTSSEEVAFMFKTDKKSAKAWDGAVEKLNKEYGTKIKARDVKGNIPQKTIQKIFDMRADLSKKDKDFFGPLVGGHGRANAFEINKVLRSNKAMREEIEKFQEHISSMFGPVQLITPDGEMTTLDIEDRGKVSKEGANNPYKPQFGGFARSFSQTFIEKLSDPDFEMFRQQLVKAVEHAYANGGNGIPGVKFMDKSLDTVSDNPLGLAKAAKKAEKTIGTINLNSACPMFMVGSHGCYFDGCYVTGMGLGGNTITFYSKAVYSGELLQLSQEDVDLMNSVGGLRMNGQGDTTWAQEEQLRDIVRHAKNRKLKLKIITKQGDTIGILQKMVQDGIDISGVQVQTSIDPYWIPVSEDALPGGVADRMKKQIAKLRGKYDDPAVVAEVQAEYARVGRETKVIAGVLHRKYGYSVESFADLKKAHPDINFLPRIVVGTSEEIVHYLRNNPEILQTWMHASIRPGMVSDINGKLESGDVGNFTARIAIYKDATGWHIKAQEKSKNEKQSVYKITKQLRTKRLRIKSIGEQLRKAKTSKKIKELKDRRSALERSQVELTAERSRIINRRAEDIPLSTSNTYKKVEDYIKSQPDADKLFSRMVGTLDGEPSAFCCTAGADSDACNNCASQCHRGAPQWTENTGVQIQPKMSVPEQRQENIEDLRKYKDKFTDEDSFVDAAYKKQKRAQSFIGRAVASELGGKYKAKVKVPSAIASTIGDYGSTITVGDQAIYFVAKSENSTIYLPNVATEETGKGLGTKFMTALKNFADKTSQEIVAYKVTNKDFFKKFSWLKPDSWQSFTYESDTDNFVYVPALRDIWNEKDSGIKFSVAPDHIPTDAETETALNNIHKKSPNRKLIGPKRSKMAQLKKYKKDLNAMHGRKKNPSDTSFPNSSHLEQINRALDMYEGTDAELAERNARSGLKFSMAPKEEKLKAALVKNDKLYNICDKHIKAGPLDGGCFAVAEGVQEILGGDKVTLYGKTPGAKSTIAQHILVKVGDMYWDADGAQTKQELLKTWEEQESVTAIRIKPYRENDIPEASRDKKFIAAVKKHLKGAVLEAPQFSVPESQEQHSAWYSVLQQTIEGLQQKTMPAKQWVEMMDSSKFQQSGVKLEEVEWSGVKEWLADQKGKVAKEQVLDFLKSNKVELVEVVKSVVGSEYEVLDASGDVYATGISKKLAESTMKSLASENNAGKIVKIPISETKFEEYTLPGGENYKEVLITLPGKDSAPLFSDWMKEGKDRTFAEFEKEFPKDTSNDYTVPSAHRYGDVASDTNRVLHYRISERMVGGEKVLHVEEIQSDWHQDGRKKGYRGEFEAIEFKEYLNSFTNKEAKAIAKDMVRDQNSLTDGSRAEDWNKLQELEPDINHNAIHDARYTDNELVVPNAPFKKSWPLLGMKRIVRYAAEHGFDKVAWTQGQEQAARYDLSKQVDNITSEDVSDGKRAIYISMKDSSDMSLFVDDKGVVTESSPTGFENKPLDEVIGKEIADKILKSSGENTYKGEDLKVGGEGMKGFYDKMLVSDVNKFFNKKAWGKARVGEIGLAAGEIDINVTDNGKYIILQHHNNDTKQYWTGTAWSDLDYTAKKYKTEEVAHDTVKDIADGFETKLHSLPITPEMQSKALTEGMPLFSVPDDTDLVAEGKKEIKRIMAMLKTFAPKDTSKTEVSGTKTRALVKKYVKAKQQLNNRQTDMESRIKDFKAFLMKLPMGVRGKALAGFPKITTAKTPETREKYFDQAKDKAEKAVNFYFRRAMLSKIQKLRRTKIKKKGHKESKLGPRAVKLLERVNKMFKNPSFRSEAGKESLITGFTTELQSLQSKEVLSEKEESRAQELRDSIEITETFGGFMEASLSELENAYNVLKSEIVEGRTKWEGMEAARKEAIQEGKDVAMRDITGEAAPVNESVAQKKLREKKEDNFLFKLKRGMSNFDSVHQSWRFLMDKLSVKGAGKTLRTALVERFGGIVHNATAEASRMNQEAVGMMQSKWEELTGLSKGKLSRWLNKMSTESDTYELHPVDEVTGQVGAEDIPLTPMEAAYWWAVNRRAQALANDGNGTVSERLQNEGIDNAFLKQVEATVDSSILDYAVWLSDVMGEHIYKNANPIHELRYGASISHGENYTPIRADYAEGKTDSDLFGPANLNSSMVKGPLKELTNTKIGIKPANLLEVWVDHIHDMNHFSAWALPIQHLEGVFSSHKIIKFIEQHHGKGMNNTIAAYLDIFKGASDGRKELMGWIAKLRSNFSTAVLGLNPAIYIKQLTSIPAMAADIPVASWTVGTVSFFANPLKAMRTLNKSQWVKTRYEQGHTRDVAAANLKTIAQLMSGTSNISSKLMGLIKLGDMQAIYVGGWAVYSHYNKKYLKQGMSKKEANKKAMQRFEETAMETQQGNEPMSQSVMQQGGAWQQVFTMFMSAPKAYYSNIAAAVRNMKKSPADSMKRLVLFGVVVPAVFEAIANAPLAGDEDDDDRELFSKRIARGIALSTTNGLFIVRDVTKYLYNKAWLQEESWRGARFSSLGAPVDSAGKLIQETVDAIESGEMDWWEFNEALVDLASYLTGKPGAAGWNYLEGINQISEGTTEHPVAKILGYTNWTTGDRN